MFQDNCNSYWYALIDVTKNDNKLPSLLNELKKDGFCIEPRVLATSNLPSNINRKIRSYKTKRNKPSSMNFAEYHKETQLALNKIDEFKKHNYILYFTIFSLVLVIFSLMPLANFSELFKENIQLRDNLSFILTLIATIISLLGLMLSIYFFKKSKK